MEKPFLEHNKKALEVLKSYYPNRTLVEAYRDVPSGLGSSIRLARVVCSQCGGSLTGPILKFFNFSPTVLCYECQKINKKI